MLQKYLPEMLKDVSDNPEKISEYKNDRLFQQVIKASFDKNSKWQLPEGKPPYKPNNGPLGMTGYNLHLECRRFYVFEASQPLKQIKREQLYIELLESIHHSEADIMIAVKDQTLDVMFKGITNALVVEAGLISKDNCK